MKIEHITKLIGKYDRNKFQSEIMELLGNEYYDMYVSDDDIMKE